MHYKAHSSRSRRDGHDDPRRDDTHPVPEQGDLLAQVSDPEPTTRTPSMTERFLEFHRANPGVYRALRDLARQWRAQGKQKCGIALLYNVARWQLSLRTQGEGAFELNDHFQSYYARALMRFEPELAGMFELRSAPEADAWIASFDQKGAA